MLTEEQVVIKLFNRHFIKKHKAQMGLYGDEHMIREIINCFPEEKLSIVPDSQVLKQCVDIIITVVEPGDMKKAFLELGPICKGWKIELYNIDGKNLFELFTKKLSDDEHYIFSFRKNFLPYRDENIVLYGKGPRTGILIDKCKDYNFIGIMDKNEVEGKYYNRSILSYEEVIERETKVIIVVAKPENRRLIYNRIYDFCSINHIALYSENGDSVFEIGKESEEIVEDSPYFSVEENILKQEIYKHQVISFSIIDTLLMYPVLLKEDAEIISREKGKSVYSMLIPRVEMVEIFLWTIAIGKKVFLINDIELSESELESFLEKYGIVSYQGVINFNKIDNKKNDFITIVKLEGKSWLHIGNNYFCNRILTYKVEVDIFRIMSASEMLSISSYANIRTKLSNCNERTMIGMLIAHLFNNPFSLCNTKGRPKVDTWEDFIYLFVAPLITGFTTWMIKELEKSKYKDILFSARDGYLIQCLYEEYKGKFNNNLPNGIYFLTSRKAAMTASLENDNSIVRCFSLPYDMSPEEVMEDKFGINKMDCLKYDDDKHSSLLDYALEQKDFIFSQAKIQRENYLKYMKNIGLMANEKYALFDLVTSGNVQYSLEQFVPFKIEGIVFGWYDIGRHEMQELQINAMYDMEFDTLPKGFKQYRTEEYFKHNYALLELILTSLSPSVGRFDMDGDPIFDIDKRSKDEIENIIKAQEVVKSYFRNYLDYYLEEESISDVVIREIYRLKDRKYTDENCIILDCCFNRDDMGLGNYRIER